MVSRMIRFPSPSCRPLLHNGAKQSGSSLHENHLDDHEEESFVSFAESRTMWLQWRTDFSDLELEDVGDFFLFCFQRTSLLAIEKRLALIPQISKSANNGCNETGKSPNRKRRMPKKLGNCIHLPFQWVLKRLPHSPHDHTPPNIEGAPAEDNSKGEIIGLCNNPLDEDGEVFSDLGGKGQEQDEEHPCDCWCYMSMWTALCH
ncbi:unnamed protein product [Cylindrotheca closterium]|uniref:Uncharacterized protein n=1 Tax=Cylindrotheca closterium TaxID=2856 RepID=A0AAD2CMZ3_9STRA|nr:unnamed protein product [Cylindrotheca closterium]